MRFVKNTTGSWRATLAADAQLALRRQVPAKTKKVEPEQGEGTEVD